MSVTINAHSLGQLFDKVTGHMGSDYIEVLNGIRLDVDSTYLYAVASDRYTMAAARHQHDEENVEPFARTVPADSLRALREWISAQAGMHSVTITTEPGLLVFSTPHSKLLLAVTDNQEFPDWRGILSSIHAEDGSDLFPVMDAGFLARWAAAGHSVRLRQGGQERPLAVFADDFVGAQMPMRYTGVGAVKDQTFAEARDSWSRSLSSGATGLDMGKDMPTADGRPRYDAPTGLRDVGEDLLRQILRSNTDMHGKSATDTDEFLTHVVGAVHGWMAYRYLEALHRADPRLAAETAAEVAEQLDSGEIGEFAWDAAESAGFDPQKWDDDYRNHLAEQAEKKQGPFADRLAAALNEVKQYGIGFTVADNAHVRFDEERDEWTAAVPAATA